MTSLTAINSKETLVSRQMIRKYIYAKLSTQYTMACHLMALMGIPGEVSGKSTISGMGDAHLDM